MDIFLQAPQIQAELHRSYIDLRIQHIHNKGLMIAEHIEAGQSKRRVKIISLLINGSYQPIVNPSKVVNIALGIEMTVRKLFKTFKKGLDRGFIDYEYLQDSGISLFDGCCKALDLSTPSWWKNLPIVERCTRAEVSEKYDVDFSHGHSLFVLRASRKYPDFHAQDTHSWIDLVIPIEGEPENFNVISVGKFSEHFPIGTRESLDHITLSHPAEITLIDPNKFYGWRERIHFAFPPMKEETFKLCMEKLRNDLLRCRQGKEYFQAQGNNCAKWVEETIKTTFPQFKLDLFRTMYTEILVPPLTPLLKLGNTFRLILSMILGAWRGADFVSEDGTTKRTIRLIQHPDWFKGLYRIPARIFGEDRAEEIRRAIAALYEQENVSRAGGTSMNPVNFSSKVSSHVTAKSSCIQGQKDVQSFFAQPQTILVQE